MQTTQGINLKLNPVKSWEETSLVFNEGQVLRAKVLEIKDNEALIKIGDLLLKGRAETNLVSGQELTVIVKSFTVNCLHFQIISKNFPEETQIPELMHLPQNALCSLIIERFLQNNLPLNDQHILNIYYTLKDEFFSGVKIDAQDVDSLICLLNRGIPLDKMLAKLIKPYLNQPALLGLDWGKLLKEVWDSPIRLLFCSSDQKENPIKIFLGEQINIDPDEIGEVINNFFAVIGIRTNSKDLQNNCNDDDLPLLLKNILQLLITDSDKKAESKNLMLKILELFTASRILAQSDYTQNNNLLLSLAVPLLVYGEPLANSIKIAYHQSNKETEERQNCQVVLNVQTRFLSDLEISLFFHEKNIMCQITTKDKEACTFIELHLPILHKQLETAGFTIKKIKCKYCPPNEGKANETVFYRKVDLRV